MRKTTLTLLATVFAITGIMAQAPQSVNYQGVARDNTGVILATQPIGLRISIRQTTPTGTVVYQETQSPTTNQFGLFNIQLGAGAPVQGNFAAINWGGNTHYLQVEMDETGGTNYQAMGTSQLLSVPYALYAESSGTVQTFTAGTGIDITNDTITNTAPDQTISLTGTGATTVTGIYPNFTINSTDNVIDSDANPTNELQTLSISNDTLSISNGNNVIIPVIPAGVIVMWSGLLINIPTGWALCNGTNGTPDLRDKFIYGVSVLENPGAIGGDTIHTHSVPMSDIIGGASPSSQLAHDPSISQLIHKAGGIWSFNSGYSTTTPNINSTYYGATSTTTGTGSNMPPYYKLAFIMKL